VKISLKLNVELKLSSNELSWNLDLEAWSSLSRMKVTCYSGKLETAEQIE